jgi:hypothetical protein
MDNVLDGREFQKNCLATCPWFKVRMITKKRSLGSLAEFERDRVGYEDAAHRPSVPAARLAKAMLELIDSYRHYGCNFSAR